jgi:hypothetical protein
MRRCKDWINELLFVKPMVETVLHTQEEPETILLEKTVKKYSKKVLEDTEGE